MNPEPAPPNWWSRNWKWVVPTGCVTLLLLFAAFVVGLVGVVGAAMRSSDAYRLAVERAFADCEVRETLGVPIEPGWFVSGSVQVTGPSGTAAIAIPIEGSARAGKIYVEATKSADVWEFQRLEVAVDGESTRIDLTVDQRPVCE